MTEEEQDEILKNSLDLIEKWGEENKPPTLWEIMRNDLGYSIDLTEEIVEAVERWLPPSHPTNDYKWEQCLKLMREKLR
jgi:hypothetical protein